MTEIEAKKKKIRRIYTTPESWLAHPIIRALSNGQVRSLIEERGTPGLKFGELQIFTCKQKPLHPRKACIRKKANTCRDCPRLNRCRNAWYHDLTRIAESMKIPQSDLFNRKQYLGIYLKRLFIKNIIDIKAKNKRRHYSISPDSFNITLLRMVKSQMINRIQLTDSFDIFPGRGIHCFNLDPKIIDIDDEEFNILEFNLMRNKQLFMNYWLKQWVNAFIHSINELTKKKDTNEEKVAIAVYAHQYLSRQLFLLNQDPSGFEKEFLRIKHSQRGKEPKWLSNDDSMHKYGKREFKKSFHLEKTVLPFIVIDMAQWYYQDWIEITRRKSDPDGTLGF